MKKKICIFGGSSSGADSTNIQNAKTVGQLIAEGNFDIVFGGGEKGIMGTLSSSGVRFGARTTGIIPEFLLNKDVVNSSIPNIFNSELLVTQTMHERKKMMYEKSDAFIILPGGVGTLDECFEVLTWCQLDLIKNKKVVIVGDILHSRVALSNIYALQLQGAEIMVCGPKTLLPKYIGKLGVQVETNLKKALNWCDVANMLRVQNERMEISYFPSTREYKQQYGVNKELLSSLNKEITIMHPGPINRGVEITSDVADSNQAIILDQVQNGVAIRMAVIYLLASKIK